MKNLFIRIYHFAFFLIRPNYWIMNEPYCKKWDQELNALMENHQFRDRGDSEHVSFLNGHEIWIANRPFAAMVPYPMTRNGGFRASRMTIYRAIKKWEKDINYEDINYEDRNTFHDWSR